MKDKKKKPKLPSSGDRGGSTHAHQKISLFKADVMWQCIDEINRVQAEAKRHGPNQNQETRPEMNLGSAQARCLRGFQVTYLYLSFLWRRCHLRLGFWLLLLLLLRRFTVKTLTSLLLGDLLASNLALAMASAFWVFFFSLISSNH